MEGITEITDPSWAPRIPPSDDRIQSQAEGSVHRQLQRRGLMKMAEEL